MKLNWVKPEDTPKKSFWEAVIATPVDGFNDCVVITFGGWQLVIEYSLKSYILSSFGNIDVDFDICTSNRIKSVLLIIFPKALTVVLTLLIKL